MASSPAPVEVVRFGEFETNLRSRELRRNGVRVRIPDQSFEVLLMLLDKPGELVTREEIRNRLWSSETFVDFDHGLNNAVKRLRDALEDSAETPRFIETLPRRGYRFSGAIDPPTRQPVSAVQNVDPRSRGPILIVAALVLLVLAIVGLRWFRRSSTGSARPGSATCPWWSAGSSRPPTRRRCERAGWPRCSHRRTTG